MNPLTRSWRIRAAATLATLVHLALPVTAQASQALGWWGGTWTCNIDGRPAKMKWTPVTIEHGGCEGDTCTSAAGAGWKGSFSDNGSRWVALSNPREGSKGGLYFNHADGNKWYLSKPNGKRSEGWTTWQGKRYKLACWR